MNWLELHRHLLGVFADSFTFSGAVLLARDAFIRLRELKKNRIDEQFRREFPSLNLTDEEWNAAIRSTFWALTGFTLLVIGFSLQILLRIVEE